MMYLNIMTITRKTPQLLSIATSRSVCTFKKAVPTCYGNSDRLNQPMLPMIFRKRRKLVNQYSLTVSQLVIFTKVFVPHPME